MVRNLVLFLFATLNIFAQSTGTISGAVIDAVTHQPLAGANVSASGAYNTTTGIDGTFVMTGVPAGDVDLHIDLKSYQDFNVKSTPGARIRLYPGDFMKRAFELHPLARIIARITDRDTGQVLAGTVYATRGDTVFGITQYTLPEVQRSNNEFQLKDLKPGDYFLAATDITRTPDEEAPAGMAGYWNDAFYPGVPRIDMATTIHVDEGEQRSVDIRIPALETHSAAGTIEAPPKGEFDGFETWLLKGGLSSAIRTPVRQPGPFRVDGLVPGTYQIKARSTEGAKTEYGQITFTITDHDVEGLKLTFQPAAILKTTVRMAEEAVPLPGAESMSALEQQVRAQSRAKQKAVQAGLPSPKFAAPALPIAFSLVVIGGLADIPGHWWTGPPNCKGWMCGPGSSQGGFAGDEGNLPQADYWPFLPGLRDGYAVLKTLFQQQDLGGLPLALRGSGELTFLITSNPGMVTGTLLDGNQAPIPHVIVSLAPEGFASASDPRLIRRSETGNHGEFSFKNLAPGKYRAVFPDNSTPVEVQPGQTTNITLRP
ncbi:MAG TPA: carboxypeptidase regulatory-like domain-containing protein [Bryobacteraceae bacterium]|jgi:hypothetical protein|nr:carboxypeptidase regulatory-like domain-containing protein [Bryobacteraceae bacterium]